VNGPDVTAAIADVASRIAQIQARVGATTQAPAPSFADTLAGAMSGTGATTFGAAMAAPPPAVTGDAVVAHAARYIGVPYQWGGTDPSTGLDCSALVQRVYAELGVTLPRVAADQARAGAPVASLADARPGDLVAFGSPADHIGIYIGDGKMIDAPHTGSTVRVDDVGQPTAIRRVTGADAQSPVAQYGPLFAAATARYGLPSGVLAAVAQVESGGDPGAVSPAGAEGLMQIMPGTAQGLGVNPFDPAQAVDGAARVLEGNLQHFGSLPLALAAYNAGAGAVERAGGVPDYPETQAYVQKVLSIAGGAS